MSLAIINLPLLNEAYGTRERTTSFILSDDVPNLIYHLKVDLMAELEPLFEMRNKSILHMSKYEDSATAYGELCRGLDNDNVYHKLYELNIIFYDVDKRAPDYFNIEYENEEIEKIKQAGNVFNTRGGFPLMLSIHHMLKNHIYKGKNAEIIDDLNFLWSGIGRWQA
jgi:hypothetical protein